MHPTSPPAVDFDLLDRLLSQADEPTSVSLPLPDGPSPAPAGATHRFGLPVSLPQFMSYEYLAGTMDVNEAPIEVMRHKGFCAWVKRTFPHGRVPADVREMREQLSSKAKSRRRVLAGKQHVWDYYAQRQLHRDVGLPVGPQNPPSHKAKSAPAPAPDADADESGYMSRGTPQWWGRRPGETARQWCERVEAEPLPPTADVAAIGLPRADSETVAVKRDAALLRLTAIDMRRDARRAAAAQARAEAATAAPDPLTLVATSSARPLTREEDVARRLALPYAVRVREDIACIVALGRPLPAMPCTTARIAAERAP